MEPLHKLTVCTVAALLLAAGCADTKKAGKGAQTPANALSTMGGENGSATANAAGAIEGGASARGVESPGVHVSEEIARACNLPPVGTQASFDFDSAAIGEQDKDLLSAVARCLAEGPLKGRRVSLVGRADPRGEDEYNMALGGSRADSVRRFLNGLGVEDKRINATSRGEIDASGKDEEGWTKDRRVDIELSGAGVQ